MSSLNQQNNNNEQKNNGLQMMGDAGKRAVKQLGMQVAQKLTKEALKAVGKKLATGVLIKTAPIWGTLLALVLICLIIITLFTPDFTKSYTNAASKEDVDKKVSEYINLASYIGINPQWIVAMDMVLHENEDLLDYDTDESTYHFMSVYYEKYKINKDGEKVIIESATYKGKKEITSFFEKQHQPTDDILKALEEIDAKPNVDIRVTALDLEFAFKDADLDEQQQEYFNDILDSGIILEEFSELETYINNAIGGGAYCSRDKKINQSQWDAAFKKAGKLSSYGPAIITISEKQGIDPVLFAAIAFHESTYGTSNAIVNKNNPGGLMGKNGLIVFSSLDEGLESMGRTLHNRIIKDGKTTIEKLGSVYAPLNAKNDPNNLNSHWVPRVNEIVKDLGGLTMNCEAYSNGLNIAFDGDVSEAAKIVATAGTKYIGNSVYDFGGGRNQSDIARGYFDCSSFVHWSFMQAGIELGPLGSVSTETLNKLGKRISINEIQVGDLIFWNTYKKDGHVGIYIGNGKWIGSQGSTGVAIVDLNNSYWQSVFTGHVRRILPDNDKEKD